MDKREKEYKEAIAKCRLLVKQRNEMKYEIVKISMKVCVVKVGNNLSNKHYNLTQFCKDIGITRSSLIRWRNEYTLVANKLNRKGKLNNFAMTETLKHVIPTTPKKEVAKIYDTFLEKSGNTDDRTLLDYTRRVRSLHFFICYSCVPSSMDQKVLDELRGYVEDILQVIKTKKSLKEDYKKKFATDLKKASAMLGR